ncbi:MAG: phytase [Chitinophagaceae bacterium]|nr:MAG: phytase [Chitinophagaceae bacterium]
MVKNVAFVCLSYLLIISCGEDAPPPPPAADALKPAVITEKVYDDTDDPAIWINKNNPDSSLIIGTDKHVDSGGVFVFDLRGKIIRSLSRTGMKRVNNVDIAYGLKGASGLTDIAVCTERDKNAIRVFSLPGMQEIDGGGIKVFSSSTDNLPMGVSLYTRPSDSAIFAIVGRKSGPKEGYLEQYLLKDSAGIVVGELVRSFGAFSGLKEIESIAVDNELGFVYYSDEQFGVRKYYADPAKGNAELAVFGKKEFSVDNEGISIYKFTDSTGYILVSDQGSNSFNIYPREGEQKLLARVPVSAIESDGSDVTSVSLPGFEGGLFVAMSTDGTFQYYKWSEIAKKAGLKIK